MSTSNKHVHGLPLVMVGISAALFLAFVYGYPRLFPLIEASHTENFEKNVDDAMARGNVRTALKIARRATFMRYRDPMAYTVFGRVLLESGDADGALEQLAKAVSLTREPPPSSVETRKPHYFAPARLTLGKYHLGQGKSLDAVENFELARVYAPPDGAEYGDFDAAQYQAYATQGLWARALEFGEPSDRELDALDGGDLVRIARVGEGEQNWKRVKRLAERLLTRKAFTAEAHYLRGRADLAEGQNEAALVHLEQAVSGGHAHSQFFLGRALEKNGQPTQAIRAFLRTPSGDLYRPFALDNALALMAKFPEAQRDPADVTRQELLGQIDQEIAGMRLLQRPIQYDTYRRFTPLAFRTSEVHVESGGRFPILILWEDGQAPAAGPTPLSFSNPDADDSLLILRRSNSILQLQWVQNLVNWESVERLPVGASALPGWIDITRDWFHIRPDHAAGIQRDDTGNSFLSIAELTWFYSVPIRVRYGVGYLLAGRLKDPNNKASLGWQSLDEKEQVLSEGRFSEQTGTEAWKRQAGYMRSQLHWDSLRVHLEARRKAGTVAFDDVMLVEINEPDPASTDVEF